MCMVLVTQSMFFVSDKFLAILFFTARTRGQETYYYTEGDDRERGDYNTGGVILVV